MPQDVVSLRAAVAALLGDVRGLLSDAADIVAAESQAALQRVLIATLCGFGAAFFGIFSVVTLLAAIAGELISNGVSPPVALLCVAVLCGLAGMMLWRAVPRILRRASFTTSRRLLRGTN